MRAAGWPAMARRAAAWARRRPFRAAALALLAWWLCALPRPLFRAPFSTVVTARDGRLLSVLLAPDQQWRFPPAGEAPPRYAAALIAAEDRRFRAHPGVDPLAVARALRDALRRGRPSGGASTITMQVVRLSRGNPPRTVPEKLLEMLLALRLELTRSKKEILALHAAHAPFGGNVVGLEAAAWRYFGRAPETLSWAESASLAVLPNAPGLIHPGRNRDALRRKRDRLLSRLAAAGRLDATALRLALMEPLPGAPKPWPRLAPHLLHTLAARGLAGRRVVTTLDAGLQAAAVDVLARRAEELDSRGVGDAAALIVDNRSFDVLAYVGNARAAGWSDEGDAVDVLRRPRSTGSILKPFLYAAMLEAGEISPTSLVPDVPTRYGGFRAENNDRSYAGAVPAREALARSLNVTAVRMLKQHGLARFHAELKAWGLTTLFRAPEQYGLSLVLGGAEGTVWEVAAAYANLAALARGDFARGEPLRAPRLTPDDPPAAAGRAEVGPGAAWLTLQALTEVARPADEAHWQNFAGARRIAWKTGTSQGFRDAWAVGSDDARTVAVWAGNAGGQGAAGLTGASAAAPVLFALFNRLPAGGWFEKPEHDLKEVDVCRDDGLRPAADCETEVVEVPSDAPFDRQSPHHRLVHLGPDGRGRVHDGCEAVSRMTPRSWFVLPPAQEHFYRRRHPEYRPLPAWRADCRAGAPDDGVPLSFLYPEEGTRLYVPTELDGRRGRAVFEVVHRRPDAVLYWHLDGAFLGRTRAFHQESLDLAPGLHALTVVDPDGRSVTRRFEVLAKGE